MDDRARRILMDETYDLIEMAWVILANVSEGDWTKQPQEWQDAVTRWRDEYHAHLSVAGATAE